MNSEFCIYIDDLLLFIKTRMLSLRGVFLSKSGIFSKLILLLKLNLEGLTTICNKQNQNRPIRTGDTACHYAVPMTSRDVIGLPPVTISLVALCKYYCFLTVEDFTKDTHAISCGLLPYRRRERRMFVIYSSAHQLCFIPIIPEHDSV